ncbi:MAG: TROVE domain-containing protein [Planctomycetales bacterium]|nr:TROVE domain-containing protein [Planctomycetales bacterium]
MANKYLFHSHSSEIPVATVTNEAGGSAYALSAKHALAQMAATGCFHGTFYANAASQLDQLRTLIDQIDDNVFLAKLAVYARQHACMKDMPAALLVVLSTRDAELTHRIFDRVVDNGRVLRTVFQMVRSGRFGRKSLSSSLQRAFRRWLNEASVGKLLSASIGNDPSLRDILRMARPTPKDNARRALFGWLTNKDSAKWAPATTADLPQDVQRLMEYRQTTDADRQRDLVRQMESVRWDLTADASQSSEVWTEIALQMGPQALRMNLNTLVRHGVFPNSARTVGRAIQDALGMSVEDNVRMTDWVASRLSNADEIRRSRQFPYQYLAAYLNASIDVPTKVRTALHDAAELACGNVPELTGPVLVGVDTSGSMNSPATGWRGHGATSKMRCVDVAALFAAAVLRKNPDSLVVPFDTKAYDAKIDPNNSILSIAERLARYGGGGTNCSIPLKLANQRYANRHFAGVILVSDNESWVGSGRYGSTGVMTQWQAFVKNQQRIGVHSNPQPKLVCIDIQPYGTTQAPERNDILNIGGFSDAVFQVVHSFLAGDQGRFVSEVEAVQL